MMSPLTTVAGGRAALVMEHKMAKLTVHITDVTGNYDLTAARLAMPSRLTTVTADIKQGTVTTVDGVKADITPLFPVEQRLPRVGIGNRRPGHSRGRRAAGKRRH